MFIWLMLPCFKDGYPMEDVEMRWRVGKKSIVGTDKVNLPQFSLVNYNTISTIQVLASGRFVYSDLLIQRLIYYSSALLFSLINAPPL